MGPFVLLCCLISRLDAIEELRDRLELVHEFTAAELHATDPTWHDFTVRCADSGWVSIVLEGESAAFRLRFAVGDAGNAEVGAAIEPPEYRFTSFDVAADDLLHVGIAPPPSIGGRDRIARLRLALSPEDETTRATAAAVRADLVRLKADLAGPDLRRELARAAARLEALVRDPPAESVAGALFDVGLAALGAGDSALAIRTMSVALAHHEVTRPALDRSLLVVREDLALAHAAAENLTTARRLFEDCLAARRRCRPPEQDAVARLLVSLAASASRLEDHATALRCREELLEFRAATRGATSAEALAARVDLAGTTLSAGKVGPARQLLEAALEMSREGEAALLPTRLLARSYLSAVCEAEGDRLGALDHASRAYEEANTSTTVQPALRQALRSNLALSLALAGDHEAALALAGQTLLERDGALAAEDPARMRAVANHALFLIDAGRGAEAVAPARAVADWAARLAAPTPEIPARANAVLGAALLAAGDAVAAIPALTDALRRFSAIESIGADSSTAGDVRAQLAEALAMSGERGSARAELRAVLALDRRPGRELDARAAAHRLQLARLELDDGDPTALDRLVELAHEAARSARSAALTGTRASAEADARGFQSIAAALLELLRRGGDSVAGARGQRLAAAAFAVVESSRSAALAATRANALVDDPALAALRAEIAAAAYESAAAARSDSIDLLARAQQRRIRAERELLAKLAGRPELAPLREPVSAEMLAGRLPKGSALLAWFVAPSGSVPPAPAAVTPSRLVAFVLAPPQTVAVVDLGEAATLRSQVDGWRAAAAAARKPVRGATARADTVETERQLGIELRERMLDPLLARVGSARRLFVIADDCVHLVPLGALPLGGDRVADHFAVQLRATAWELVAPAAAKRRREQVVLLGAPAFDGAASDPAASPIGPSIALVRGALASARFEPLPATLAEVNAIAAQLRAAAGAATPLLLVGADATKASLFAAAGNARWLHLATHGYFLGDAIRAPIGIDASRIDLAPAVAAGIALAGANLPIDSAGRSDGIATAEELSTLDLAGCELVVVSACESSVGRVRQAQGIASVQHALHLAGARHVVATLWPVGDDAARAVMEAFYRELLAAPDDPAAALRRVQEALCRGDSPFDLSDWAPWVVSGGDPLPR